MTTMWNVTIYIQQTNVDCDNNKICIYRTYILTREGSLKYQSMHISI
jgi:hypothetical protein